MEIGDGTWDQARVLAKRNDIEALLAAGAIAGRGMGTPGQPSLRDETPAATPVSVGRGRHTVKPYGCHNIASAKKPLDQLAVAPGCFELQRTTSRFVPGKTCDLVAASPALVHENVRLDNACGRNVTMAN